MALTQLYIAQSLDGYIADEAGGVEWLERRGQGGDFGYHEFLEAVGAIAMGAATYEQIVGWDIDWPYPGKPTWVFTHRELPVPEGADVRFTDRPASEVVAEIERETDANVWLVGGGELARQWIDERVLDELILFVVPLLLGGGVPLFGDTREADLELTDVRSYPNGFVELRYRFRRPVANPGGARRASRLSALPSTGEGVPVEHHGSESYFVLGEGLLDETLGGRPRTLDARVEAGAPRFRFSRLGPSGAGKQLSEAARRALADAMTADNRRAGRIDAGYTYLGQFIDHDLTFDRTGLMEGETVSPAELESSRSPTLDLDSLYGAGPENPASAKFYSDGLRLKLGKAEFGPPSGGFDLPRRGTGGAAKRRKAVIPDPRNDENLAVAQLHLAFMRFHNRVVDTLPGSVPPAQRFREARKIATLHYQWMIRTDYLPKICERSVVTDVFRNGRKAFEVGASPTSMPTMPLEFSVAAFRLGHSMVRANYSWNINFPDATLGQLFDFSGLSGNLGGGRRLPSIWIADFRRLFDFGVAGRNDLKVPAARFNRAMRIDTKLVDPLRRLRVSDPNPLKNLAFRNLLRARMLRLATGQQMATFLRSKGVTLTKLTRPQIREGNGGAALDDLTAKQRDALLTNTPLWFYLLRESELNGGKLDGVGARIVAETFHRAMEGSRFSIVRDPAFRPSLGPDNTTFRMVDLLLFAFEGKKKLLNPLGP